MSQTINRLNGLTYFRRGLHGKAWMAMLTKEAKKPQFPPSGRAGFFCEVFLGYVLPPPKTVDAKVERREALFYCRSCDIEIF